MANDSSTSETTPPPSTPTVSASTILASTGIPTKTTKPKELLRHDISDDELDLLMSGKKDGVSEAMWAFIGGAIGTISPAVRNLSHAYGANGNPLSALDLMEVTIFFVSCALALGSIVIIKGKGKTSGDLADEIRSRKKY